MTTTETLREALRGAGVEPCTDGHCIFRFMREPGGMHTNGGCRHLKQDRHEMSRTMQALAIVFRAAGFYEARTLTTEAAAPPRRETLRRSSEHGGHYSDCIPGVLCHCPLGPTEAAAGTGRVTVAPESLTVRDASLPHACHPDGDAIIAVARYVHWCATSWEPGARLLGNCRAEDVARLCEYAIKAPSWMPAIPAEGTPPHADVGRVGP